MGLLSRFKNIEIIIGTVGSYSHIIEIQSIKINGFEILIKENFYDDKKLQGISFALKTKENQLIKFIQNLYQKDNMNKLFEEAKSVGQSMESLYEGGQAFLVKNPKVLGGHFS